MNSTMHIAKTAKYAAIPVGLLVSGLMVMGASHSAFTATTSTGDSTFKTGAGVLSLTNDHVGKAVFAADSLLPGSHDERDVHMTYQGQNAQLHLHASAKDTRDFTTELGNDVTITVREDATQVYQGTLTDFIQKTSGGDGIDLGTAKPDADFRVDYQVGTDPAKLPSNAHADLILNWTADIHAPST